ncbi:RNA polymerase sigma factor [Brevibacillus porteri]|uniref:RNA polymerase n=1 Tax=Brevibacillus porteri TaxID=2126350 RepID=A0ABX5FLZ1_9BACL|nr:RNA polymerase sigma factor [Brevibacillus porteri]MED1799794.1 RNA polymerase sigma factor [Brevibacillus porteri]MED2132818.1 RNA polymerase sigma factor [Brevibacillus porteri]MED2744269.1 RNA polymerase sigma factor [Brevibacillus porteri]MED2816691.1 RNA polymerase sigma factor [Brevibacillus porteri]MED2894265.1 RNA polymerase sigma factor [Brevibacillus porteri]
MDTKQIEELVNEIIQGGDDRYAAIMKSYQTPIFHYCYHILGNRCEAEDATQEVFFKAYRNLKKYSPTIPFAAWLYKIAYHHCIDLIRKRKWTKLLPFLMQDKESQSDIEWHIENVYFSEDVFLAMQTLSVEERTLLLLRGVEEKTYEEISLIMNKNAASLRKKFERTASKFRSAYSPLGKGGSAHDESKQIAREY